MQSRGEGVADDLVKSIVITKYRIYLSGISTLALKDRTRAIYDMGK